MTPQLKWVERCARCYRPGIAIVYRRRGPIAALLGLPKRTYRVCIHHLPGRSHR